MPDFKHGGHIDHEAEGEAIRQFLERLDLGEIDTEETLTENERLLLFLRGTFEPGSAESNTHERAPAAGLISRIFTPLSGERRPRWALSPVAAVMFVAVALVLYSICWPDSARTMLSSAMFWRHLDGPGRHEGPTPFSDYQLTQQERQLFAALNADNLAEIARLLNTGVDPNVKEGRGTRPLAHALSVEAAELLVGHGADFDWQGVSFAEPMWEIVRRGRTDVAMFLLEQGTFAGKPEPRLQMAATAISRGAPAIARRMLDEGYLDACDRTEVSTRLYFCAVTADDAETLDYLDRKGIERSEGDSFGRTLLHWAGKDSARWLIERGADVNAEDFLGRTPLDLAMTEARPGAAEVISAAGGKSGQPGVKAFSRPSEIVSAIGAGDIERANRLLDDESVLAEITGKGKLDEVFRAAARSGDLDLMRRLLSLDPDRTEVNKRDFQGSTTLTAALMLGHRELAAMLIGAGALIEKPGSIFDLAAGPDGAVKSALQAGESPRAKDSVGRTALHYAAAMNNSRSIRMLLDAGAEPDVKNVNGVTPLSWAIRPHSNDAVRLLLDGGADPLVKSIIKTPFATAAECGNVEALRMFLDSGVRPGSEPSVDQGAMHQAAFNGQTEAIELLLERGFDPQAATEWGLTPLHQAAGANHPDAVRVLVGHGAQLEAKTKDGKTPLWGAVERGCPASARALLDAGADPLLREPSGGWTLLHQVCARRSMIEAGDRETLLKMLLDAGCDPSVKSFSGHTPLDMLAVPVGEWMKSAADTLAEAGGEYAVNAPGVYNEYQTRSIADAIRAGLLSSVRNYLAGGVGPDFDGGGVFGPVPLLSTAITVRKPAIIEALLEAGADPNLVSKSGKVPLVSAIHSRDPRLTRLLLEHGADPNAGLVDESEYPDSGLRLIHLAAISDQPESVKMLAEFGADVNARGDNGVTPLQAAVQSGAQQAVDCLIGMGGYVQSPGSLPDLIVKNRLREASLLLARGENPNLSTKYLPEPLRFAVMTDQPEMVVMLVESGADPNRADAGSHFDPLVVEAVTHGKLNAALELINHGADVSVRPVGRHGTLLHYAARYRADSDKSAEYLLLDSLLQTDLAADSPDWLFRTPLHVACEWNAGPLVAARLIEAGAPVDGKTSLGHTPLHIAASKGSAEMVKLLLERGADPTIRDNAGLTPLDKAQGKGRFGGWPKQGEGENPWPMPSNGDGPWPAPETTGKKRQPEKSEVIELLKAAGG